jgi:hypothetical protein
MEEELALALSAEQPVFVGIIPYGERYGNYIFYIPVESHPEILIDRLEISDFRWTPLVEALRTPLAFKHTKILWALASLFGDEEIKAWISEQ